ncbi:unnamed protein product, partial [Ectocarpus sp. 6 AP-2014]
MDVLRDAEKTEKSTGVGSPTFRRLSAVTQVVEHVVDLVHHHGVLLVSGEHVLLHGAKEVQPEPLPAAGGAFAAGGAAAGGSGHSGAGASASVPPMAGLQHVDLTGGMGARGSTVSGASGSGADTAAAKARDDAELIKLLDSPPTATNAE